MSDERSLQAKTSDQILSAPTYEALTAALAAKDKIIEDLLDERDKQRDSLAAAEQEKEAFKGSWEQQLKLAGMYFSEMKSAQAQLSASQAQIAVLAGALERIRDFCLAPERQTDWQMWKEWIKQGAHGSLASDCYESAITWSGEEAKDALASLPAHASALNDVVKAADEYEEATHHPERSLGNYWQALKDALSRLRALTKEAETS